MDEKGKVTPDPKRPPKIYFVIQQLYTPNLLTDDVEYANGTN